MAKESPDPLECPLIQKHLFLHEATLNAIAMCMHCSSTKTRDLVSGRNRIVETSYNYRKT